jgi:hypothetical protein
MDASRGREDAAMSVHLDDFMMQSWVPQPHQMLPENEPGTSTWLLKQIEALR